MAMPGEARGGGCNAMETGLRALEITRRRGLAGKPGCIGRNGRRRNLCLEE